MTRGSLNHWILFLPLIGWLQLPSPLSAQSRTVVVDVALDARTLSYTRPDAWTSGPSRGDTYVLSGYVYNGFNIPDGDTTASFAPDSDASIGTILISGVFTASAASIGDGVTPSSSTTHVFSFYNADGLVTQGMEGVSPVIRALLGGTGQFSGAVGQVTEEVIGNNGTGGLNLRFTFQLVPLNPQNNDGTSAAVLMKKARPRRP